jgi:UDP-N-acetylmuramoyl-tripeptide--D-alanyl-D-alanine ligase
MSELRYTPEELAAWSTGRWTHAPSVPLAGVSTDSKAVATGALFIALKGRKHDAHAFVPQALAAGAAAAVVRDDYVWPADAGPEPCLLRVADPNRALSDLAAAYRRAVGAHIVGVTGSAGKTTVKEMTAQLLSMLGPTARTPGNKNNEIGLPLSLLAMPRTTLYGVFEAGMSHPGEIAPLCATMQPDCGIVTNVGPVHLEAFGSVQAIANEKSDLLRCLPKGGLAALDRDNPFFDYLAAQAPCEVVDVSQQGGAAFSAEDADLASGMLSVRERGARRAETIVTGLPGVHNLCNALLATAMARRLGVAWDAIREAFQRVPRPPMRWEVSELHGVQVINDAYNANPMSLRRALETFAKWPCKRHRVALLGDMLELGAADEESLHLTAGRDAAELGVDELLLVGARAGAWMRLGAIEAHFAPGRIHVCADTTDAARRLSVLLKPGDALLLKGSRGMTLETTLDALRRDWEATR